MTVLRHAGRRHVVLLANLRETAMGVALAVLPSTFDEALRTAGIHLFLQPPR